LVAAVAGWLGRYIAGKLSTDPEAYPMGDNGVDWQHVSTKMRVDHILHSVLWSGFTWAVIGAAVALWLTIWLRSSDSPVGRLILGGLVGAAAGLAGAAVHAVPFHTVTQDTLPKSEGHVLFLVGLAVTGALVGALVGWIWRRRGSAGFAAGLVGGALWYEIDKGWSHGDGVTKAGLAAAMIVGFAAVTQALLDVWAERSPRALASSRGP
jgi:peptidoglycan/LPS O-acetylase OafA/YrhL